MKLHLNKELFRDTIDTLNTKIKVKEVMADASTIHGENLCGKLLK